MEPQPPYAKAHQRTAPFVAASRDRSTSESPPDGPPVARPPPPPGRAAGPTNAGPTPRRSCCTQGRRAFGHQSATFLPPALGAPSPPTEEGRQGTCGAGPALGTAATYRDGVSPPPDHAQPATVHPRAPVNRRIAPPKARAIHKPATGYRVGSRLEPAKKSARGMPRTLEPPASRAPHSFAGSVQSPFHATAALRIIDGCFAPDHGPTTRRRTRPFPLLHVHVSMRPRHCSTRNHVIPKMTLRSAVPALHLAASQPAGRATPNRASASIHGVPRLFAESTRRGSVPSLRVGKSWTLGRRNPANMAKHRRFAPVQSRGPGTSTRMAAP